MDDASDSSSSKLGGEQAKVLVLLCTYNESTNIPKMFELIQEHLPAADILVVDDNSPDGTADVVRQQDGFDERVHLLLRAGKLGLGSALRDGIEWCLGRDYDFLINMDADVSHHPVAAPEMLKRCIEEDVDIAVGSRYIPGGASPGLKMHRKWISRLLNTYAIWLLKLPLTDCSGSYRCYSTAMLRKIDIQALQCPGYGFLEEILVALKLEGARFGEVPIVFDCRYSGTSKLSLRDAIGALRTIHQEALRRRK